MPRHSGWKTLICTVILITPGCCVVGDLAAGQHWCPQPLFDLVELQLHNQPRTTNRLINQPTWQKITTSCTRRRPSFASSASWAQAQVFFRSALSSFYNNLVSDARRPTRLQPCRPLCAMPSRLSSVSLRRQRRSCACSVFFLSPPQSAAAGSDSVRHAHAAGTRREKMRGATGVGVGVVG